ncbi:unnamed protein product [Prunus brigantina]
MPIVQKNLGKPPLIFCELMSTSENAPTSPTSKLTYQNLAVMRKEGDMQQAGHPLPEGCSYPLWRNITRNTKFTPIVKIGLTIVARSTMFRLHPELQSLTVRRDRDHPDKSTLATGQEERTIGRRKASVELLTKRRRHSDRQIIGPQTSKPFCNDLPHADPTIRLLLQKVNQIEEEQNQTRTPTFEKLGTVDSFDQLKQTFLNHFMIYTDRLYSTDDLYTIRQRDDEPLREYAARFSHEYSRCLETDDRTTFGAFKSSLRPSQFRYLIHSSNWANYSELMKQAAIHAKAEHFNSKGVPSASPCLTVNVGQNLAPAYDRFPPHQTMNQAPHRTAPTVSAPYTIGDKRRDGFQGPQDGSKGNKDSGHQGILLIPPIQWPRYGVMHHTPKGRRAPHQRRQAGLVPQYKTNPGTTSESAYQYDQWRSVHS